MKRKIYVKPQIIEYELQIREVLLVVSAREGYQNGDNGWEELTNEMLELPNV